MNKLDKYIISNYIKSFILGMMMFYLIFLLAESISLTGWLMDGKLKGHDAIKYLRYGTPEIITNTAPLGVLLGSLLCISKMAKQLEIAAINYDMLGKSNTKKENLKSLKIDNKEPVRAQKKFVFVKIDKRTVLYSENVNKNTGTMEYIEIFKFEKGFSKIGKIYTSPFAKINLKTNVWTFKNLKEYDSRTNLTKPADTKKFKFIASMEDVLASPVKAKNLTMPELREKTVYFTRVGADSLNLRIEFYYRISFALSSFVMCLIGLSLGSRYVRGGAALNIGLSVIIGYAYYGISTILRSMAVSGTVPIYAACFIPLIVFLVVGIKLFRDSEY